MVKVERNSVSEILVSLWVIMRPREVMARSLGPEASRAQEKFGLGWDLTPHSIVTLPPTSAATFLSLRDSITIGGCSILNGKVLMRHYRASPTHRSRTLLESFPAEFAKLQEYRPISSATISPPTLLADPLELTHSFWESSFDSDKIQFQIILTSFIFFPAEMHSECVFRILLMCIS